jgi:hypothetical protein
MGSTLLDWEAELARWLKPFLDDSLSSSSHARSAAGTKHRFLRFHFLVAMGRKQSEIEHASRRDVTTDEQAEVYRRHFVARSVMCGRC